jgi:PIN domain nuclease of toxin-antitoxin system
MTYLFNTSAWLRIAEAPESISTKIRQRLLLERENDGLSVISIWELALKLRKHKLTLSLPFGRWLKMMLRPSFVDVLPIDIAVARLANELPGTFHDDPADRFIVATALHHDLTIITSDTLILAYPHVRSLDTR